MPLYQYIKTGPGVHHPSRRPHSLAISFTLISLGGSILLWVLWPIVSFTVFTAPLLATVVSPLTDSREKAPVNSPVSGVGLVSPLVLAAVSENTPEGAAVGVDYTNANVWFPTKPQKKVVTPVNTYTLSIPKLKIERAAVVIAGDDLNQSLIHYGGTGLPGEYGTAIIFGHSVLPQFFNPRDYKTIFSTLPTIKVGDDIFITYDGITYRYEVHEITVTEAGDLSPLEQQFDDSHITLITCVPPGTYWKRLNVKARLAKI